MPNETGGWGDKPSILIVADGGPSGAVARAAAEIVGARVIGTEPIAAARERLERQVAVDCVLIELGDDQDGAHGPLLDWANDAARDGKASAIISVPHALINDVFARMDSPGVALVSAPALEDWVAELSLALAARRHGVHEPGGADDAERLRRLSEEAARIAKALADLARAAPTAGQPIVSDHSSAGDAPVDAQMVRGLIRVRRARHQFFAKDLFADPAWDMLLDLLAARLERSRVAVSSLCIAAGVPATTALRWIRMLTDHGLFERSADPEDGRRIFIELSDAATEALKAYFQTIQQMGFRMAGDPSPTR